MTITQGQYDRVLADDVGGEDSKTVPTRQEMRGVVEFDKAAATVALTAAIVAEAVVTDTALDAAIVAEAIVTDAALIAAIALDKLIVINDQTGTTYTLVLADGAGYIRCSNGSAITVTIPTNAAVAFPIGTQITIIQIGAGQVTLAGAAPPVLNTGETLLLRAQWSICTITKVAADVWDVAGDMQLA